MPDAGQRAALAGQASSHAVHLRGQMDDVARLRGQPWPIMAVFEHRTDFSVGADHGGHAS
ncbi:hypothetical protein ACH35V_36685 [Actinomadura sp. 1N219]|uniref:hypothetical protein n=1 Tax=Actinomadura sp. 1N219 TaxID=3375152 RepID=UPI0037B4955B